MTKVQGNLNSLNLNLIIETNVMKKKIKKNRKNYLGHPVVCSIFFKVQAADHNKNKPNSNKYILATSMTNDPITAICLQSDQPSNQNVF